MQLPAPRPLPASRPPPACLTVPHMPARLPPPACSWREAMWFVQRLLVLVMTSLPGSFVLAAPGSAAFGFGLGSLTLEMLTRRVSAAAGCASACAAS